LAVSVLRNAAVPLRAGVKFRSRCLDADPYDFVAPQPDDQLLMAGGGIVGLQHGLNSADRDIELLFADIDSSANDAIIYYLLSSSVPTLLCEPQVRSSIRV